MAEFNPPKQIHLQTVDQAGNKIKAEHSDHITWCEDQINRTDPKYVRADVVDDLLKQQRKLCAEATNYVFETNEATLHHAIESAPSPLDNKNNTDRNVANQ